MIRGWTTPHQAAGEAPAPFVAEGQASIIKYWRKRRIVLQGRTYWILILSPWYWHCTAQNHNVFDHATGPANRKGVSGPGVLPTPSQKHVP